MLKISNGRLITDTIEKKDLYIKDGKIFAVTNESLPFDQEINAAGKYVCPGFIDTHVHGGGGFDFVDGDIDAMKNAAKTHLTHGTTSICPTTIAAPFKTLKKAIMNYKELSAETAKNELPNFVGLHLEGPYFAASQAGGQPLDYIRNPNVKEYEELLSIGEGCIKKWTFAPELPGSIDFCKTLVKHGCIPCIGHTDAEYKDVLSAYRAGAKALTHFYSSMSTITRKNGYRILGAVEAGYLIDEMYIEVIADGIHLPPALLSMICKLKNNDKIMLITDAMRGAGMPEGPSFLGRQGEGQPCIIEDGVAKMPDRSGFAGSVATADRLVRTMVNEVKLSLSEAVKMLTKNPADFLGLSGKGRLKAGYDADIVLLNESIAVDTVIVNGNIIL